jgi:hypothetical protein
MKIDINVKRKFKINGKEYNSIEEMPDDIREAFKKAIGSQADPGDKIKHQAIQTKIIFNGTEYDSIDAIPQEVRQLYEKVLKTAENEAALPEIDVAEISSSMHMERKLSGTFHTGDNRKPTKFEPSFSPRALIVSAILGALVLLVYYLLQSR